MKQYAIGIDFGGTMIKYAIVSSDGEIIYQSSTLTPLDKGGNGIVDAFIVAAKAAIDEASQRGVEISGIGIGTPGIVSKDGRTVVGGAEVGGGIAEAGSFYLENLSKEVFSRALPVSAAETRLVAARLGNTAGCLGAASLAFRNKEI